MSEKQKSRASLTRKGSPKSAAHRAKIAASWDEKRRSRQAKIATAVNKAENAKLQDFACPDCGEEFKQVAKGVYGAHRRTCPRYREIRKAWEQWDEERDGSVAEFAEKHGIHRATVHRWKNELATTQALSEGKN